MSKAHATSMQKACLSKSATGLALGVTWGLYMLVSGWLSVTGWCANVVQNMSAMYTGYEPGFVGGIVGGIWGFIDGFIAGFLIAYFYNYFYAKIRNS